MAVNPWRLDTVPSEGPDPGFKSQLLYSRSDRPWLPASGSPPARGGRHQLPPSRTPAGRRSSVKAAFALRHQGEKGPDGGRAKEPRGERDTDLPWGPRPALGRREGEQEASPHPMGLKGQCRAGTELGPSRRPTRTCPRAAPPRPWTTRQPLPRPPGPSCPRSSQHTRPLPPKPSSHPPVVASACVPLRATQTPALC